MMNTVRVITIRPNPPSCQQNTHYQEIDSDQDGTFRIWSEKKSRKSPSRASDTGDRQDSDVLIFCYRIHILHIPTKHFRLPKMIVIEFQKCFTLTCIFVSCIIQLLLIKFCEISLITPCQSIHHCLLRDHEKIRKFLDSNVSVFELIDRTSYLQQYPSWLGYCGPENKKKYTPTYINRNDNIWELVFSERGYVDMLLIVRDLYMKPFPKVDVNSVIGLSTDHLLGNTDLCTALFPCINELVASHEKIFRVLAGLHLEREDHVVPSLGAYLVQLFDPESLSSLSQLYGHFLYAQKRIRERLQACKNHARIAAFFQQVKQNPRSSRKSLEDCYMVIVQRWTKVETLLESIIRNTLNDDEEVANLEISRKAVKSIIKSSETILTEFEYTGKLREFAMLLDVSDSTTGTTMMSLSSNISSDELRLLNELKSPNAKLINHGRLYANPLVSGCGLQSSTSYEVEGVALKSCFFMLQKIPDSNRYQLFRGTEMPPILWWGKHYGYFRKSGEKASFGFYILLHSTTALTLFRCATVDELARWETIFNDGFAQWREHMDTFESLSEEFSKARDEIAEKQKRTEGILELLYQLNDKRLTFWKIWEFISSVLISERLAEMEMSTSKSESLPALTQNNSNRATIKVDVTSPPSTPNSNNNNNAQQITTMDMLKLHTFISNLDTYNDLDQLFDLFHEHFIVCLSLSSVDRLPIYPEVPQM
ncbi:hypothetical protein Smp_172650 [Schistosoma mansoni]|uniref:hypothetical protein n=1 Tax=Schistosoma mansoni TaxID=6183 RepID=UPI00022DC0EB|nr:hypothetical protein Smp_172650 [Schistosoma mansoni]|eukprot:XP_018651641.1 hypothetical protein Smp_172650 [Schistosoma mansoni]